MLVQLFFMTVKVLLFGIAMFGAGAFFGYIIDKFLLAKVGFFEGLFALFVALLTIFIIFITIGIVFSAGV